MKLCTRLSLLVFALVVAQENPLEPGLPTLRLRYPASAWIEPGTSLLKSHTQSLPIISAMDLDHKATYLLLFVDLDVVYGSTATVALHWYQPNMVATSHKKDDDDNILVNLTVGAEYIAPRPPPNTHHRYVYLLFDQPADYKFPVCFSHIFPPTAEARAGFDIRQFQSVAQLHSPVAGNYFIVHVDDPPSLPLPPSQLTPTTTTSLTTTSLRSAPCQGATTAPVTALSSACESEGWTQVVMSHEGGKGG
ncbi:hypothetical protein FE257_010966 [Aspergillus nanangensis]|uniref:PEBP-like protein n=1 Tax=Aspergillus nanangensis TaxID=2582783 RepID=A0AAD4GXB7_ASPNN|nr:hypothetical protein FE257_010966 [Aspergillus nanangensis]